MKLIRQLSGRLKADGQAEHPPSSGEHSPAAEQAAEKWNATDSLGSRLINAVQDVVESREILKHRLAEVERDIADRDLKIQEQKHELVFLEKKVDSSSKEIVKLQETIKDQKLQYEQISNDYAAFRVKSEKKTQDLQDRLTERELTNRQLMLDLNRGQKEHETRRRELETRERELQIKHQHLEEKYKHAMNENERLLAVMNEFASQATSLARREKMVE